MFSEVKKKKNKENNTFSDLVQYLQIYLDCMRENKDAWQNWLSVCE